MLRDIVMLLPIALIVSIVLTVLIVLLFAPERRNSWNPVFLSVVYVVLLFVATIGCREIGSVTDGVNLTPFNTLTEYDSFLGLIENIVLFIPLGFILRKVTSLDNALIIIVLLFTTCGIEATQYILECGYTQLDDIIMNLVGGIIGMLLAIPAKDQN